MCACGNKIAHIFSHFNHPRDSTTHPSSMCSTAVSAMRAALRSGRVKSSGIIAAVEGIHDQVKYAEYAKFNSSLLKPFADSLCIVSRAYMTDMRHYQQIHPSYSNDQTRDSNVRTVDRVPIVLSSGDSVLQWIASADYMERNLKVRHESSRCANVYIFWSDDDDLAFSGDSVGSLRTALTSLSQPVLLVEGIPESAANVLDSALADGCATPLLQTPNLHVLEGSSQNVSAFTLPSWEHVERCSDGLRNALLPYANSRVIAFQAADT